jgi:hypothetical protein
MIIVEILNGVDKGYVTDDSGHVKNFESIGEACRILLDHPNNGVEFWLREFKVLNKGIGEAWKIIETPLYWKIRFMLKRWFG